MTKAEDIAQLNQELEENARELPLAQTAQDIIPGEGSPDAEIMFIGEAPGYYETVERRPFVGRSGQLFRKVLQEVGIAEQEVYISNVVKARPPENRDPLPEEIAAYKPFLNREIEIIQPVLVVTLGRFSMGKFLPDVKVSQVHGRLHRINWYNRPLYILPMYHPSAALRGTKIKQTFIDDFSKLPKLLTWIHDQQETDELKHDLVEALL
jgi:uracil-DNA glycosylase family 4